VLRFCIEFLNGIDGFCPWFLQKDMISYIYERVNKPLRLSYIFGLSKIIDIPSPLKEQAMITVVWNFNYRLFFISFQ